MIYFILAKQSNKVKIGYTSRNSATYRLKEIQPYSPEPLKLIKTVKGEIMDEKMIHCRYWRYHIHNEWFTFAGELRKLILSKKRYNLWE